MRAHSSLKFVTTSRDAVLHCKNLIQFANDALDISSAGTYQQQIEALGKNLSECLMGFITAGRTFFIPISGQTNAETSREEKDSKWQDAKRGLAQAIKSLSVAVLAALDTNEPVTKEAIRRPPPSTSTSVSAKPRSSVSTASVVAQPLGKKITELQRASRSSLQAEVDQIFCQSDSENLQSASPHSDRPQISPTVSNSAADLAARGQQKPTSTRSTPSSPSPSPASGEELSGRLAARGSIPISVLHTEGKPKHRSNASKELLRIPI